MKKLALEKNKEYSEKYHQKLDNFVVPEMIKTIMESKKIKKIIDLGCGEGMLIGAINNYKKQISGVDISPRRINELKLKYPQYKFYCTNVCETKIKEKFDFILSTQVIEHVPDDKQFISEIKRISKSGGYIYITSVIKKPWAIYKYRNNGKFVLDPTHEREYQNPQQFLKLFEGLKILGVKTFPVKRGFGPFNLRVPGYSIIEVLAKNEKN